MDRNKEFGSVDISTLRGIPKNLEIVLGRAIIDGDFRKKLFMCPEKASNEYGLDEKSLDLIKSLDPEEIERLAKSTENEIVKNSAGIIFCVG